MMDIVPFASLEEALKKKKISQRTYDRVKIAKNYIEKKYKMKKFQEEEKKKEWDLIMNKIEELNVDDNQVDKIKKAILHKEGEMLREKRQKMNIRDFESISIIGKGAFGEVRVCRHKQTGEIVAIKKMKKDEMYKKNQILHVRAERDVLSEAKIPWIVELKYSFQDDMFLYLVMEFCPGGDLMSLLINKDILTEDEARFYIAELVLAVESVHKLKCIHRDLKPDNILIDKNGHIKLSDFGLSKKIDINLYDDSTNTSSNNIIGTDSYSMSIQTNITNNGSSTNLRDLSNLSRAKKKRILAFSTVGTPDYIAPEVLIQKGYGPEIDWWSIGVILFEMLVGYPPFFSDSASDTCKKILNWKYNLVFPDKTRISDEALDLIKKLIIDVDKRLGYNGAEDIKKHPFFRKTNWDNLIDSTPPFIPRITSEFDTQYFENFEETDPFYPEIKESTKRINKDICFVDFTYKREFDNQRTGMLSALEIIDSLKESMKKADEINENNNQIDIRNPSFNINPNDEQFANILQNQNNQSNKLTKSENKKNMNVTYDHQIVLTEKDSSPTFSPNQKIVNSNSELNITKNIQTVRKEIVNTNKANIINTIIETGEINIINMNNTYDYNPNISNVKQNQTANKDISPFKNSKTTTNKKNIQINIPDSLNQFSLGQEKIMNINLYSNKANINKNFNIQQNNNLNNPGNPESDKKNFGSKPKYQQISNNLKSPISTQKENNSKMNFSTAKGNYNINYNQMSQLQASNNKINQNNSNLNNSENFQEAVNNIKNSIITGMGTNVNNQNLLSENRKKLNDDSNTNRVYNNIFQKSNSKKKNPIIKIDDDNVDISFDEKKIVNKISATDRNLKSSNQANMTNLNKNYNGMNFNNSNQNVSNNSSQMNQKNQNQIITTNYLKDFIHSENTIKNKTSDKNIQQNQLNSTAKKINNQMSDKNQNNIVNYNPNSQNKYTTPNNMRNFDSTKNFSTKNLNGKKFVFNDKQDNSSSNISGNGSKFEGMYRQLNIQASNNNIINVNYVNNGEKNSNFSKINKANNKEFTSGNQRNDTSKNRNMKEK